MQKPMSKLFYLAGYFGGMGVGGILLFVALGGIILAMQGDRSQPPTAVFGLIALPLIPILFSVVVMFMFIHRMWSAIQDEQASISPGKAVGLMFIPLFNLYWMFRVFYGFAQDYNKYIARHGVSVPRLNEQIFLYYPISVLACVVPLVNYLAGPASMVLMVIVMVQTCDAVNALMAAPQRAMGAVAGATPGR